MNPPPASRVAAVRSRPVIWPSADALSGGSISAIVTWKTASLSAASPGDAITVRPDTRKVSRSPNATSIGLAEGLKSRSLRPASARLALSAAQAPICNA